MRLCPFSDQGALNLSRQINSGGLSFAQVNCMPTNTLWVFFFIEGCDFIGEKAAQIHPGPAGTPHPRFPLMLLAGRRDTGAHYFVDSTEILCGLESRCSWQMKDLFGFIKVAVQSRATANWPIPCHPRSREALNMSLSLFKPHLPFLLKTKTQN